MTDVQLSLRGTLGWNACYYGGLARLHIKYNRWWLVNTGGWGGGVWEMFAVSALVSQDVFTRLNIYPSTRRSQTFVCVGPVHSSPPTASKKV